VRRRIFGPRRDERTAKWRKLHNEELLRSVFLTKQYSSDQTEKNEMGGTNSTYVKEYRGIQGFDGET